MIFEIFLNFLLIFLLLIPSIFLGIKVWLSVLQANSLDLTKLLYGVLSYCIPFALFLHFWS